jgi:tight adherence protein C
MNTTVLIAVVLVVMFSSLVLMAVLLVGDSKRRLQKRLVELSSGKDTPDLPPAQAVSQAVRTTLPKLGKHLMPRDTVEQTKIRSRLIQAGLYHPQALPIFLGVKMFLIVLPIALGLLLGLAGLIPTRYGLMIGACASIGGMIVPSFWLDRRKRSRQSQLRRAMPDALDLMVICMEAGLSLRAALQRITDELASVHPLLSFEMKIVQREVQLGHALGDALRTFAVRSDIDDIRNLSAAIKNAERFGSSMVKTLRTFAETLRVRRQQRAEEMAQKAGTKILFPTLLFIFPAIFLIILGPAAIQLIDVMQNMKK